MLAVQQAQVARAAQEAMPLLPHLAASAEQVAFLDYGVRADQVERQDLAELVVQPE